MNTKLKTFSISILLALVLLVGILALDAPLVAQAEAPEGVYVGNVWLSSGSYLPSGSGTVVDEKPEGGYAYFDAAGLVLKDYVYDDWGYEESQNNFYLIYAEGDLNVYLEGENSLLANASQIADFTGIYVRNGSLNIKGPGKLTVDASMPINVYTGDISIEGGRLNLTHRGNNYGMYVYGGSISISGGIHSVTGFYGAVYSNGGTTMSGGSLTATGTNCAIDGAFTMTYGSLLAIATGDGMSAFDTGASDITDFSSLANASAFGYDNVEGNSAAVYDDADKAYYKRVFVKPTVHNVWVGGTQLSDTNMSTEVFFEPLSRTLTLTDYSCVETSGYAYFEESKALVYSEDDLNIVLSGENTLTAKEGEDGIRLADGRLLTIDTAEGETGVLNVSGAYGIGAVSEIKGGKVTVVGTETAMIAALGQSAAPDLRYYYETPYIKVSKNANGTAWTQDYDATKIDEYKHITFAEGVTVEYYVDNVLKLSVINEKGTEYQLVTCRFEIPTGYTFGGWGLGSADSTTVYGESDYVPLTEDVAFHAVLKQLGEVYVYYPSSSPNEAILYELPYGTHSLDFIDDDFTPPEGLELKGFTLGWTMGESVTEIEVGSYPVYLYAELCAETGGEFYDLYVGGIAVTNANKDDILGDGTTAYNSTTNTLTLTEMDLAEEDTIYWGYEGHAIFAKGALNIVLVGENGIVTSSEDEVFGILAKELNISAIDDGFLSIESYYAINAEIVTIESGVYHLISDYPIYAESVTINGGEIAMEERNEGSVGIDAEIVTINGGVIDIKYFDCGINAYGTIIKDGTITIITYTEGISAYAGLIIEGGAINIYGMDGNGGAGILVNKGDISITGEDTSVAIYGFEVGIYQSEQDGNVVTIEDATVIIDDTLPISSYMLAPPPPTLTQGMLVNELTLNNAKLDVSALIGLRVFNGLSFTDSEVKITSVATDSMDEPAGIQAEGDSVITNSKININIDAELCAYSIAIETRSYGAGTSADLTITDSDITITVTTSAFAGGICALGNLVIDGCNVDIALNSLNTTIALGCNYEDEDSYITIKDSTVVLSSTLGGLTAGNLELDYKNDALKVWASENADGSDMELAPNIEVFEYAQYCFVHPIYEIILDGNNESETDTIPEQYGTYTLPTCSFTAPENKEFLGWAIGAVDATPLKQAGDEIKLSSDLTIYAIWKEKDHVHSLTPVVAKEATCTENGNIAYYTCNCGQWFSDSEGNTLIADHNSVVISATGHNYEGVAWSCDANEHYKVCKNNNCNEKGEVATHTPNLANPTEEEAKVCTVCEYVIAPALNHVHTLTPVVAKGATCTENGNIAYYTCTCGQWFSDSEATNLIANHDSVIVVATGHVDQNTDGVCDTCGYVDPNFTPVVPGPGGSMPGTTPGTTPDNTPDNTPDTTPEVEGEDEAGLSGGAIAGIAVGATAGAVALGSGGFAIFWFVIKKKSVAELLAIIKKTPKATPQVDLNNVTDVDNATEE